MTKYLNPGPFSGATSNGKMSDLEYQIAVGALVWCDRCQGYRKPEHDCQEPQF